MAAKVVPEDKLHELAESDATVQACFPHGFSPGYVSARLKLSRQMVHKAISQGRLEAIRVVGPRPFRQLRAIYVSTRSIEAYERAQQLRAEASEATRFHHG